jgi:O-methyltransferase
MPSWSKAYFRTRAPRKSRQVRWLCHIDVDVYESAKEIVAWVEQRMPPGAVLVFDDYGFSSCIGVTCLVNEIRENGRWFSIYNLNGHAVLIKRPLAA